MLKLAFSCYLDLHNNFIWWGESICLEKLGTEMIVYKNFYKPTCLVEFSLSSCLWTSGSLNLPLFFSSLIPCLFFFPLLPIGSNSFVSLDFLLPPFSISRCVLKTFLKNHIPFVNFSSLSPAEETFLELTERRRKRKFPRINRKDSSKS